MAFWADLNRDLRRRSGRRAYDRAGRRLRRPLRWNVDKKHRCPACHAVAVDLDQPPRSWRVYTCCQCAARFTRWPRLVPILSDVGVRCSEHTCMRCYLDGAPWWARKSLRRYPLLARALAKTFPGAACEKHRPDDQPV